MSKATDTIKAIEEADEKAKKLKKAKHITIIGKRWFQKGPGNTYHSVRVIVDGNEIGHNPYAYGYGDQYIQTAFKILQDKGYYPKTGEKTKSGFDKDEYDFINDMRNNHKKFTTRVTDVEKKALLFL